MALDRKSATARRDLQRPSPTFVQKREIFERLSHKSKALNVIISLSRPIGAVFGLSTLFYYHRVWPVIIILLQWFGLSGKSPWYPRGYCPWFYKISYSPTPFLRIWKNLANFPLPRGRESNQSFVFPDIFPWLARGPTPGGSRWHVHNA